MNKIDDCCHTAGDKFENVNEASNEIDIFLLLSEKEKNRNLHARFLTLGRKDKVYFY